MSHLNQEFYRSSYRNAVNTIEARDPRTGMRMMGTNGKPISKYVVNREETGFKKIKMTRSFLRCEILLQPSLTSYAFQVLENVSANNGPGVPGQNPTEQRLKLQDVFFCNRLGFYIYCAVTNGGSTEYRYMLITCPVSTFLSGGVDPVQMYSLWTTGTLNVTFNNDVLTPAWDLLQHMYVPMQQGDPSGGIGPVWNYLQPIRGTEDSLVIVEPNWVLNGGNGNEYTVNYPQSLNTMGINSTTAKFYLVLKLEGFLAQNCSGTMNN